MPFPCASLYVGVEGVAVDPEEGPSDSGIQKLTSPAHGSRGKQVYRLTTLGRRNLQQEITRLRLITRLASLRVASKET